MAQRGIPLDCKDTSTTSRGTDLEVVKLLMRLGLAQGVPTAQVPELFV